MSSSYESSLTASSGSLRSSIVRRLKSKGLEINPIRSDTSSTITDIRRPGRLVGSLLSRAGRRFERAVDRFAEEQLGLGPNAAALRLTSALHDIHVSKSPKCPSDHSFEINNSLHFTDRLIWACNGFCSRCHAPYLPQILTDLPESALRAIVQLMKYLQPSQPPSIIGIASIFIRILIQSHVMAVSLVQGLNFLEVMQTTREIVWPSYTSRDISPEGLVSLKSAMTAIQEMIERDPSKISNSLIRFGLGQANHHKESLPMLLDQFDQIRNEEWALKEIKFARLLTELSAIIRDFAKDITMPELQRLLSFMTQVRMSLQIPNYLEAHITQPLFQAAATLSSSTALSLTGHNDWVWSVAWLPEGTKIISCSDDRTVRVWDANNGSQTAILEGRTTKERSVAVSPDGAMFASGHHDKSVRLWDVDTGNSIAVLKGHTARVWPVAFAPDGASIASGSGDKSIRLWDTKTGLESRLLSGHTNEVISVAFSPDGYRLVSGSLDNSVRLWNVRTGKQMAVLSGRSSLVHSAAFSPDGMHIASGSLDRTIRFWDVRTGRETGRLDGHTGSVKSVAFAPDSSYLVSGSGDKTVRLWDVKTRHQIAVLRGHIDLVMSVAFSPNGNYIASGSWDKTILVWDVSIFRAIDEKSNIPLHAQAEEVELGIIPEDFEFKRDSGMLEG